MKPERQDGAVKGEEPMLRANCSSVLRSDMQGTGGGGGRRSGAERRPPSPPGLSKAHIF